MANDKDLLGRSPLKTQRPRGLSDRTRGLATLASVAIGGKIGGKVGAAGAARGVSSGFEQAEIRRLRQAESETNRQKNRIATQLALVNTGALAPESAEKVLQGVGQEVGLAPSDIQIQRAQQGLKSADLIELITSDIDADAKGAAWSELQKIAPGLGEVSFNDSGLVGAFDTLTTEQKETFLTDLRSPESMPEDIDLYFSTLANFNGPGEELTGPQLSALLPAKDYGTSVADRLMLIERRAELASEIGDDDLFRLGGAYLQAASIMGIPMTEGEEFGKAMGLFMSFMEPMLKNIREGGTTDMSEVDNRRRSANLNETRRAIASGNTSYNSAEQAIESHEKNTGDRLSEQDRQLITKWINERNKADAGGSE